MLWIWTSIRVSLEWKRNCLLAAKCRHKGLDLNCQNMDAKHLTLQIGVRCPKFCSTVHPSATSTSNLSRQLCKNNLSTVLLLKLFYLSVFLRAKKRLGKIILYDSCEEIWILCYLYDRSTILVGVKGILWCSSCTKEEAMANKNSISSSLKTVAMIISFYLG